MPVELMGDSSSKGSATVKSDREEMLIDGDWVAGEEGMVSVSGTDSSGEEWENWGSRSVLGSPRDVATGVALGSSLSVPFGSGVSVVNAGGEGSPSQPRSRNSSTSWTISSAMWLLSLWKVHAPVRDYALSY